eukprot:m.109383 g.109383  ORF g.109383 m.109383 type:complete len:1440 (-) comp9298_c0_seq1:300-4619(-)
MRTGAALLVACALGALLPAVVCSDGQDGESAPLLHRAARALPSCIDVDLGNATGSQIASGTTAGGADRFAPSCQRSFGPERTILWRAPSSEVVVFSTAGSEIDTVLAVHAWSASRCAAGKLWTELACNDDTSEGVPHSRISLPVAEGWLYVIVVHGFGGISGKFKLSILPTGEPATVPSTTPEPATTTPHTEAFVPDGACYDVDVGFNVGRNVVRRSSTGSVDRYDSTCTLTLGAETFVLWRAPYTHVFRVSTEGSSTDTVLSAHRFVNSSSRCISPRPLACSDDIFSDSGVRVSRASALLISAEQGQEYVFVVEGYAAFKGAWRLNIDLSDVPAEDVPTTPQPLATELPPTTVDPTSDSNSFTTTVAMPVGACGRIRDYRSRTGKAITVVAASELDNNIAALCTTTRFSPELRGRWTAPATGVFTIDVSGSTLNFSVAIVDELVESLDSCRTTNPQCNSGLVASRIPVVAGQNLTFVIERDSALEDGILVLDLDFSIPDRDGDGVPDDEDAFPDDPTEFEDTDNDGIGDNADPDDDNDGFPDDEDAFPKDPNEHEDSDGDGTGDNSDPEPFNPDVGGTSTTPAPTTVNRDFSLLDLFVLTTPNGGAPNMTHLACAERCLADSTCMSFYAGAEGTSRTGECWLSTLLVSLDTQPLVPDMMYYERRSAVSVNCAPCTCYRDENVVIADCRELNFTSLAQVPTKESITVLLLARNSITSPGGLFAWPNLNILDLSFNGITAVDGNTFAGADNLRELSLRGNELMAFSTATLPALTKLDLRGNPATELRAESFASFPALETLQLGSMIHVQSIQRGTFDQIPIASVDMTTSLTNAWSSCIRVPGNPIPHCICAEGYGPGTDIARGIYACEPRPSAAVFDDVTPQVRATGPASAEVSIPALGEALSSLYVVFDRVQGNRRRASTDTTTNIRALVCCSSESSEACTNPVDDCGLVRRNVSVHGFAPGAKYDLSMEASTVGGTTQSSRLVNLETPGALTEAEDDDDWYMHPAVLAAAGLLALCLLALCFIALLRCCRSRNSKRYHAFISYRLESDGQFATDLSNKLRSRFLSDGTRVQCFIEGEDNINAASAIKKSCVFVPIISKASIQGTRTATSHGTVDSMMYECEAALELQRHRQIAVQPVVLNHSRRGMSSSPELVQYMPHDDISALPTTLTSGTAKNAPVRDTLHYILEDSVVVRSNPDEVTDSLVDRIVEFIEKEGWVKTSLVKGKNRWQHVDAHSVAHAYGMQTTRRNSAKEHHQVALQEWLRDLCEEEALASQSSGRSGADKKATAAIKEAFAALEKARGAVAVARSHRGVKKPASSEMPLPELYGYDAPAPLTTPVPAARPTRGDLESVMVLNTDATPNSDVVSISSMPANLFDPSEISVVDETSFAFAPEEQTSFAAISIPPPPPTDSSRSSRRESTSSAPVLNLMRMPDLCTEV